MTSVRTRNRVQLTLSSSMRIALEHLAARNGTAVSYEAALLLRQALDRTIQSAEVQRKIGEYRAFRTASEWRADQTEEHVIEKAFSQAQTTSAE